jgi:TolA-binding protein
MEALQRELHNHARRTLLNTNARLEQSDENCRRAEAARAAAMARILELEGQLQKAHGQIRLLQKELRQQGLLLEQTRDNAVRLEGELQQQQQRQQNRSRPPRNATVAKPAVPGTCDDAQRETFEF